MLQEELLELAGYIGRIKAETQSVEVKAAHQGCPRHLYDTLSSFANQDGGGTILFGLDEQQGFVPVGVYDLQDLQKQVTEQCNQMEPKVRAVFTFGEPEGKPMLLQRKGEGERLLHPGGRRRPAHDRLRALQL